MGLEPRAPRGGIEILVSGWSLEVEEGAGGFEGDGEFGTECAGCADQGGDDDERREAEGDPGGAANADGGDAPARFRQHSGLELRAASDAALPAPARRFKVKQCPVSPRDALGVER